MVKKENKTKTIVVKKVKSGLAAFMRNTDYDVLYSNVGYFCRDSYIYNGELVETIQNSAALLPIPVSLMVRSALNYTPGLMMGGPIRGSAEHHGIHAHHFCIYDTNRNFIVNICAKDQTVLYLYSSYADRTYMVASLWYNGRMYKYTADVGILVFKGLLNNEIIIPDLFLPNLATHWPVPVDPTNGTDWPNKACHSTPPNGFYYELVKELKTKKQL